MFAFGVDGDVFVVDVFVLVEERIDVEIFYVVYCVWVFVKLYEFVVYVFDFGYVGVDGDDDDGVGVRDDARVVYYVFYVNFERARGFGELMIYGVGIVV